MHLSSFDLKSFLVAVVLTYSMVVLLAFIFQRHLMFFPAREPFVPKDWTLAELKPVDLRTSDGLALKSWYHAPHEPRQITIVFFQGNAGHLGYRSFKVQPWLEKGYGVLLVGYRGYNGNPGSPSEDGFYRDARAAIDSILKLGTPISRLVLYGESIGTGVATQMATEYPAAAMILESPFTSMTDVAAYHYPYLPIHAMLRDRFDSLSRIGKVNVPLLLIHGDQDRIVPFYLGKKLFDAANEPKQALFVPNAGHNDLYDWGVQADVRKFIDSL